MIVDVEQLSVDQNFSAPPEIGVLARYLIADQSSENVAFENVARMLGVTSSTLIQYREQLSYSTFLHTPYYQKWVESFQKLHDFFYLTQEIPTNPNRVESDSFLMAMPGLLEERTMPHQDDNSDVIVLLGPEDRERTALRETLVREYGYSFFPQVNLLSSEEPFLEAIKDPKLQKIVLDQSIDSWSTLSELLSSMVKDGKLDEFSVKRIRPVFLLPPTPLQLAWRTMDHTLYQLGYREGMELSRETIDLLKQQIKDSLSQFSLLERSTEFIDLFSIVVGDPRRQRPGIPSNLAYVVNDEAARAAAIIAGFRHETDTGQFSNSYLEYRKAVNSEEEIEKNFTCAKACENPIDYLRTICDGLLHQTQGQFYAFGDMTVKQTYRQRMTYGSSSNKKVVTVSNDGSRNGENYTIKIKTNRRELSDDVIMRDEKVYRHTNSKSEPPQELWRLLEQEGASRYEQLYKIKAKMPVIYKGKLFFVSVSSYYADEEGHLQKEPAITRIEIEYKETDLSIPLWESTQSETAFHAAVAEEVREIGEACKEICSSSGIELLDKNISISKAIKKAKKRDK